MAISPVVSPSPTIAICGSRLLPSRAAPVVTNVVRALVAAQRPLSIGCAAGADAMAVSAVVSTSASSLLSVYAIGGQCGSGFVGNTSAVTGVISANTSGASVVWWAGGSVVVPVRQRLVARSLACVSSAGAVVAFVSELPSREWSGTGVWRSCGSGTWSTVAAAAACGCNVIVLPIGSVATSPLPSLPVPGAWVQAGQGIWSSAFKYLPDGLI